MSSPKEQLERLKAAFPEEYVTIKCEMHYHGATQNSNTEFVAYAESQGGEEGASVKDAVDRLLAKKHGILVKDDASETLTAMEQDAQTTEEAAL